ncbi:MAG: hypothetical protein D4R64_07155 [Porphyromonadaceae bacterium]|nr:MAG: hypothetical protein D4R64_07155 [Porphyromonadaceae bacterium]
MKLIKNLAGLSLLILLLTHCSGLSELPASWGNNPASPDVKPTGFNPDSKTGWMCYNDSTHLYFAFSFFDPRVQTRILRSGMTVFIDTTGKMKEGCFVRFPLINREVISGGQAGQKLQPRQGASGRGQRTSTDLLLDQAQSFELQWQKGKVVIRVNPSLDRTDFKTSIGLDTTHALNIVIGVPLKLIHPAGLPALDKMVIGLRFGESPAGSEMSSRPQMAGNQQSVLGGSSAGIGGGGGGERPGMNNTPIEFWYKTKLAKK